MLTVNWRFGSIRVPLIPIHGYSFFFVLYDYREKYINTVFKPKNENILDISH